MNKHRLFSIGGLLATGVFVQCLSADASTVDRIIAIVNGDIITASDLKSATAQARLGLLGLSATGTPARSQPSESDVLEQLIDQKLQLQLAEKQGITVEPEEVNNALQDVKRKNGLPDDSALEKALLDENFNFDQYKNGLKEQIMILKLVNREVKAGVVLSDEEIRAYHAEHSKEFLTPLKYRLHQILIPVSDPETAPDAEQIARKAADQLNGGADLDTTVREYSVGNVSVHQSDLGVVRADYMQPEIRQAIESLKPGEYSAPVRTTAGIHIFRMDEVLPPTVRPVEEVKGEIQETLYQQRAADLYEKWLKDLRASAQVEIKY